MLILFPLATKSKVGKAQRTWVRSIFQDSQQLTPCLATVPFLLELLVTANVLRVEKYLWHTSFPSCLTHPLSKRVDFSLMAKLILKFATSVISKSR